MKIKKLTVVCCHCAWLFKGSDLEMTPFYVIHNVQDITVLAPEQVNRNVLHILENFGQVSQVGQAISKGQNINIDCF